MSLTLLSTKILDLIARDSLGVYRALLGVPKFAAIAMAANQVYRAWFTVYEETPFGSRWTLNGMLHREGDLPAAIDLAGNEHYYRFGSLHRDGNLPAVYCVRGTQEWWFHGVLIAPIAP